MHFPDEILYSEKYFDEIYEYRNVHLPEALYAMVYKKLRRGLLLDEREWRHQLQIAQSEGWEHYEIHMPELNILLFRKRLDFQQQYRRDIMIQNQNYAQENVQPQYFNIYQ